MDRMYVSRESFTLFRTPVSAGRTVRRVIVNCTSRPCVMVLSSSVEYPCFFALYFFTEIIIKGS